MTLLAFTHVAIDLHLAGFVDVFQIVIGVILSLGGLGLLLMGFIAITDRDWRQGGIASLLGAVLAVAGMWLVGVLA